MYKNKNFTIKFLIFFIFCGVFSFFCWKMFKYQHTQYKIETEKNVKEYLSEIYEIERVIIENIPIYSDYKTSSKEKILRKYLFKDHIRVARIIGVGPVKNDNEMADYSKKGLLINIDDSGNLYYFYGVPKKYRYLTPGTGKGINLIANEFQNYLKNVGLNIKIKLAISSALRPQSYQRKLQYKNVNAVVESTHSYGVSFDIFWDDFFVVLPEINVNDKNREVKMLLRNKFGFVLGDSLRRQLKTVLAATLIKLQDQGKIYAIMERNQRCYHITILK